MTVTMASNDRADGLVVPLNADETIGGDGEAPTRLVLPGSFASPVQLVRRGPNEFALAPDSLTVLSRRSFGFVVEDSLYLTSESVFRLIDHDGDAQADELALEGEVLGYPAIGGLSGTTTDTPRFFDLSEPVAARLVTKVQLSATGDAMRPRLDFNGTFLREGSAVLQVGDERIAATPIFAGRQGSAVSLSEERLLSTPVLAGSLIQGFVANVSVAPGSSVTWQVQASSWVGPEPEQTEVAGKLPALAAVDGSFESEPLGALSGNGAVVAECLVGAIPAISGARSLSLPSPGDHQLLRLTAKPGATQVTFVGAETSWGTGGPLVIASRIGSAFSSFGGAAEHPLTSVAADCTQYPEACSALKCETNACALQKYSIELPPGDGDVLISISNTDVEDDDGRPRASVCLDDLKLE